MRSYAGALVLLLALTGCFQAATTPPVPSSESPAEVQTRKDNADLPPRESFSNQTSNQTPILIHRSEKTVPCALPREFGDRHLEGKDSCDVERLGQSAWNATFDLGDLNSTTRLTFWLNWSKPDAPKGLFYGSMMFEFKDSAGQRTALLQLDPEWETYGVRFHWFGSGVVDAQGPNSVFLGWGLGAPVRDWTVSLTIWAGD